MRHLTRFPLVIFALVAATLACSLGPSKNSNNNLPTKPISTAYIPPAPTNTPTPESSENSESSSQNTSSSSQTSSNSNSASSSGSSSSSSGGFVACNPRTDWYVYRVVSGDTLAGIARRVNSSVSVLSAANCLANANTIRVGQALYVPQLPVATNTPAPTIGISGFVTFNPYLFADAGNYYLMADTVVTLSYSDVPSGTVQVDFLLSPSSGNPALIGSDTTISDGINVPWTVPSELTGNIEAYALRSNGTIIQRSGPAGFGTSKRIPNGTCVLQSATQSLVPMRQEPRSDAPIWGDLIPGQWLVVDGQTNNGWIAVQASGVPSSSIYQMNWVAASDMVQLLGPCNNLKTIHINLASTGCLVSGTPDLAIPYFERPYDDLIPLGTIDAGTSYEVMGRTSTGWYGISTSSPDVASGGYGAYGLRWIKNSGSLPPSPPCQNLPTIY